MTYGLALVALHESVSLDTLIDYPSYQTWLVLVELVLESFSVSKEVKELTEDKSYLYRR